MLHVVFEVGFCRSCSAHVQIGRILACLEAESPDFPTYRCGVCFSKSACSVSSSLVLGFSLSRSLVCLLKIDYGKCEAIRSLSLHRGMIESSSFSCFIRVEFMSIVRPRRFWLTSVKLHFLVPRFEACFCLHVLFTIGGFLSVFIKSHLESRIHVSKKLSFFSSSSFYFLMVLASNSTCLVSRDCLRIQHVCVWI